MMDMTTSQENSIIVSSMKPSAFSGFPIERLYHPGSQTQGMARESYSWDTMEMYTPVALYPIKLGM